MRFYNILDEQDRFVGFKVDNWGDGLYNSHTYSYLGQRKMYQEIGDIMGFSELENELEVEGL